MSTHITIKTYPELERWVDAFLKENGLKLLFLVGNPGTGKSALFKAKFAENKHHLYQRRPADGVSALQAALQCEK